VHRPSEVWLYRASKTKACGGKTAINGGFRMEVRKAGRGERARASLTQRSLRFVMINRTPRESLPEAGARSA